MRNIFHFILVISFIFVLSDDYGFHVSLFRGEDESLVLYDVITDGSYFYVIGTLITDIGHGTVANTEGFLMKYEGDGSSYVWKILFGETDLNSDDKIISGAIADDGDILVIGEMSDQVTLTKIDSESPDVISSGKLDHDDHTPRSITVDPSTGRIAVISEADFLDEEESIYTDVYVFDSDATTVLYNLQIGYWNYKEMPSDSTNSASGGFIIVSSTNSLDTVDGQFDIVFYKYSYDNMNQAYSHYISLGRDLYDEILRIRELPNTDVIISGQFDRSCVFIIRATPSTNPLEFIFAKTYCYFEPYRSFTLYNMEVFPSLSKNYVVVVGDLFGGTMDEGFVLRVSLDDGELLIAEYTNDVYAYHGICRSEDDHIVVSGKKYRSDSDTTYEGKFVMFRDEKGVGCELTEFFNDIIVTNISHTVEGSIYFTTGWWPSVPFDETIDVSVSQYSVILFTDSPICCNGIRDDSDFVCSGHGACDSWGNCTCDPLYPGDFCEKWSCFGVSVSDVDTFCGNNITSLAGETAGLCVDFDECFCLPGYSSLEINRECTQWQCEKQPKDDPNVCTGRGSCVSSQTCECIDDFEGSYCETWSCWSVDYKSESSCSGNGNCKSPNQCECSTAYTGDNCQTNLLYYTVMTPVLTIFGISTIFLFCLLICCVLMTLLCCLCAVYLGGIGMVCLGGIVLAQKLRMKKFDKLRNVDIILREQELEEDETVAHLNINKSLFEVPYEAIHLECIIGEGGSNSVVYRATWRKQIVAFKCFKTRQICNSQDSFDEFEDEVKVMSSISHPNIIRFFGGSLQPPRVGIVMEYCDNGDLVQFLKLFSKQSEGEAFYPLEEKVRMIHEIASALEYIHSRNILHRDLKLENVLVDVNENTKLMDFGLSKIVERISRTQTRQIGTNIYMSPEIVNSGQYGPKTDVFSFSILMFIMITQNWNPYGKNESVVEIRVSQDPTYRPDIQELDDVIGNERKNKWLKNLIICLWDHEPQVRKSFSEILEIIEERTVVEDVLQNDELSVRSDSRKKRKQSYYNLHSSTSKPKMDDLKKENRRLLGENNAMKKKDRLMTRQLYVVQKEKERLTRILKRHGVDFRPDVDMVPSRNPRMRIGEQQQQDDPERNLLFKVESRRPSPGQRRGGVPPRPPVPRKRNF